MDPTSGKPLAKNELLKADKPDLSGTIRETLANPEADRFSGDDEQFIKFHGIYQQDDRDKRKTGKEYSVMVRTRQTGGIVPAAQYLVYDELSGRFANGTLRITSRQTFQFHGVLQKGIGPLIKSINDALSSTLATCGDVNRNVTAPSNPPVDQISIYDGYPELLGNTWNWGYHTATHALRIMFGGVFVFIHRNARLALAVGIVTAGVGAASVIGWITAPV